MGLLADLLEGSVQRDGIKVVNDAVTFEGFDAMRQNSDVVRELVPNSKNQSSHTNFSNWGLDENGKPVIIDQE
jgi:hypothetical protein